MKGLRNGREVETQYDKYGQPIGEGLEQWKAPHYQDLGGAVGVFDGYGGRTGSLPKSATFADRTAAGHLNIAQDRLKLDQGNAVSESGGPSQAAFTKQFGKASPGFRWKADGSQEFIPGGPADQKSQATLAGQGTVDEVVAGLRDKYSQLNEGGGITSTSNGVLGNTQAWLGSSAGGQAAGRVLGTQNQSARNSIAMSRPLLLQAIMKATGMSAKQMDSNAELKLYLSTATDPTLDLEANMAALDRIEKLYGSGNNGKKPATDDKTPKAKTVKRTGTSSGRKVVEYSDGSIEYAD
jgi:hypothetical protein